MINFDKGGNIQFGTENNIQFTQPAEAAGTWNQFQADFRRTGYLPNGVSGTSLNQQQNTISLSDIFTPSFTPVSDNNQIFANGHANLLATSIDGSNINWTQTSSDDFDYATCAPIGDIIFTMDSSFSDKEFIIFDKTSGNQIDSNTISGGIEGNLYPFFLIQNELLYAHILVDQGQYSEIDLTNLTRIPLTDPLNTDAFAGGIAHTENNILTKGNIDDPNLRKFDFSGNLIDTRLIGGGLNQIVINLDDSVVYANIAGGNLAAINIDTFNTEWESGLPFAIICIDEDVVYATNNDDVFKINKTDGSLIEFITLDNTLDLRFPAVTSDTLYVAGTSFFNGRTPGLAAFNKDDLSQIFFHELPENNGRLCITESSVAVLSRANDEMYVIS